MGAPERRTRRSDPAVFAGVLVLLIGIAALSLWVLLESRAVERLLREREARERVEQRAEPGALPAPAPPGAAPRPGAPRPIVPIIPPPVEIPDTPAPPPPPEAADLRSFGVADIEAGVLARLDRDRPGARPLTGIARVRIDDLVLDEPGGERFATAESLAVGLDLGALRGGDVLLTDVVLVRPDVRVRRAAGQPWNFERVWRRLVGPPAEVTNGGRADGRTVRLEDVRIVDGRVAIETATTRLSLLDLDADVAHATLADPAEPSPEIQVRTASADVVRPATGQVFAAAVTGATVRLDDGASFTAEAGTLDAASLADIRGTYGAAGLELALRAEGVPLADLQWLLPDLPDEGTASFELALAPLDGGRTRVTITDLDARSGASRLSGAVAVLLGPPGPTLESADLRADPLELALLEPLIGAQPFGGQVRGTITASAGALSFEVAADLTADGAARPFAAVLTGTAEYGPDGFRLTGLVADLADAPLAALRPLIPGLPLEGTVSGRIAVLGAPGAAPLDVDVRLALAAGTFFLRGEIDLRGRVPAYDLTGRAAGISLAALFGERAPPALLTADFSIVGSGTSAETADLQLRLSGRFTGWRTDAGDAVEIDLQLADGVLNLERGVLGLATLDLAAEGTWRFVEPAAGGLRYAARFDDLAPFAPYLPFAPQGAATGTLATEGSLTGPAGAARLAGTATGEDLRLDGWRAGSLEAAYEVTLGRAPAEFAIVASARDLVSPGAGAYDTARVTIRQTPPLFSVAVAAEQRGGGVLELAADGRLLEGGRRDALVRRFVADVDARRWTLARPARIAWGGDGGFVVRDLLVVEEDGPGRLAVDGRVPVDDRADLAVETAALPIGGLVEALAGDTTASGLLWLDADVGGLAEAPVVRADFRVEQAIVQGVAIGRLVGDLRFAGERLELQAESLLEPARALEVRASLPFELVLDLPPRWRFLESGAVRASVMADSVGIAAFEPWLADVRDLEGAFSGRATVTGTVEAPRFGGTFALRGGAVTVIPFDQRYTEISADVDLEGQRILIRDLRARSDGWAVATGTVVVEELSAPVLDLRVTFDGFRAFSAREREAAALTGEVAVTGPLAEPVVGGRVVLEDGTVPVDAFTTRQQPDLLLYEETELLVLPGTDDGVPAPAGLLASVTFDRLLVVAGEDLWFDTQETRVQLAGDLVITGRGDDVQIFGTLQGERGTFTLEAGPVLRRFDVERAEVRFLGETPPNPALDVTAVRTVPLGAQREIAIVARITGTASNPVVAFTTPEGAAIPESELLSFLVFGRPSFALGETEFLGQVVLGEFFITGLTELTAIEIEEELAADLGLDFFEIRPGFGAFGGLGLPTLVFGKEVAEDVFLTVEAGLGAVAGVETTAALAVRLQWRIDDQWQLELALEPATRARLLRGGTVLLPLAAPEQQLIIIVRRRWTY